MELIYIVRKTVCKSFLDTQKEDLKFQEEIEKKNRANNPILIKIFKFFRTYYLENRETQS